MTVVRQVTLNSPVQVAVLSSLDRIQAAVGVEANQLTNTWNQPDVGQQLLRIQEDIRKLAMRYVEDAQRSIVVTSEMPSPAANLIPDASHRAP